MAMRFSAVGGLTVSPGMLTPVPAIGVRTSAVIATMKNFDIEFALNSGASGYQKLPSGIILQWGITSVKGTDLIVTFPIAFPNTCTTVQISPGRDNNIPAQVVVQADAYDSGRTSFRASAMVVSKVPSEAIEAYNFHRCYWLALGF